MPRKKKPRKQQIPNARQDRQSLRIAAIMAESFPEACASEMTGSSMVQSEEVSADGNIISGSAMPVSTP